ncbi:hypothetical protein CYV19_14060 [Natronobacterium gregoryi SP2]|uniref:Uncharacterized protein n=1 Tax=Natronobacterium gregoryi (strain ATCC 43098 / DSM 3393 / CCM 3738 / CIP 104747 / IAM 13177 / JCM 8860 / NBRC 102187 / NCIMB 2189 / SP2) TaxID=797304 RepID=A0A2J4JCB3_NATGS|nr:hypothetical protein CYV19_14060 [Natronobacterium gregoryi SP2]
MLPHSSTGIDRRSSLATGGCYPRALGGDCERDEDERRQADGCEVDPRRPGDASNSVENERCSRTTRHSTPTAPLVPSQPSTDGSNRATPPDSTHQCRLGPPLALVGRCCRRETTGSRSTRTVDNDSSERSDRNARTLEADRDGARRP